MIRLVGGTDFDRRAASERAFNQRVGGILRAAREERKIPRSVIAEHLSCDETQVMRYESGATPLKVVVAARFCNLIKLDPRELFR